eukprot:gene1462-biopygen1564
MPKHQPRWYTPLDVQQGISQIIHDWETTVRSLTFPNGTPPEVWSTGVTPAEWRTQDVSNLHSLRIAALRTFKLLKSNLHARKRKELSIRVSVHIASREGNILVSDMHAGIQSLLNEIPTNTPLEQLNFGDEDYTPRSLEELHTYMTAMFDCFNLNLPHLPHCTTKNGSLSLNLHGYLPKRGADTANLRLLNTLETVWDEQRSLYGCSWNMKKAFDSVSKPLILLCWQRLGVPLEIAQWLVDLDEAGFTIVRTPFALERWDLHGLLGGHMLTFGATREGLQRTAGLVPTYAMVFNLSIASHKLRAFHSRGLLQPLLEPLYILVYDPGWVPQRVYLKTEGTFKSLGVEYPINPGDSKSFAAMKLKLIQSLRAISIKKPSARAVNVVLSKCHYIRGAYVGVLSSWSLALCEELDQCSGTVLSRVGTGEKSMAPSPYTGL